MYRVKDTRLDHEVAIKVLPQCSHLNVMTAHLEVL